MSLCIWLPMTKDLRNQGLSNITATNSGATYSSTGGKLGGCYSFDGTDDAIGVGNLSTIVDTDFSWSCWFYRSEWSSKSWETIFGGPSGFELETKSSSTNSPLMYAYSWGKGTFTYELNQWNHLVMTRTTSETKFYLNGELKLTGSAGSIPSGNYFVGSWSSTTGQNFKGKVNDVRIYDHCLSPMEVKELSKGLVLHYPLNRGGWGQENLFLNSGDLTKWNVETGIEISFDTEEQMYKIVDTTHSNDSRWGIYQNFQVLPNTTYTFSIEGKAGTSNTTAGIFTYESNTAWPSPVYTFTSTKSKCIHTFTTGNNHTVGRVYLGVNTSSGNKTAWYKFPKLELGSVATPWCPNSSDTLATAMGLNGTTEYDCSGFCNNGTRTGIFSWTSDTPKYSVSTQFNGTQYIQAPFSCGTISEAVSVAVWGCESNWNTSSAERLIGACTKGSGWCIGDYGSENTLFAFYANGSYNTATGFKQLSVGWHHFVITFDGLHLNYYVDGQLFSSKTFSTKQIATGNYNIEIGRHYGDGCNFKGRMSDVRIYATALSTNDVKSLYQNSAYIDSSGNVYGAVHSEV